MTISEMICKLQEIKCEYGDLPVAVYEQDFFLHDVKYVRMKGLVNYDERRKKAVEMWCGKRHVVVF